MPKNKEAIDYSGVGLTINFMKVSARDIAGFVKNPPKAARVILIYGPDSGLMKERAKAIGLTIVSDLTDPFNVADLDAASLQDDPARLSDEACAISMMGGDRLIRIQGGADALTPLLKTYLDAPSETALVVIEAGDLNARSSLRKLCEGANNAAALPCYVEDERDLARFVRDRVAEESLRIEPDAVHWLSNNIQGDRGRARSEVEKLILYKGQGDGAVITLDDVLAICGANGAVNIDDFINAVGLGQAATALQHWGKLNEEGISFIVVVRSLQNHFKRLHQARSAIDAGNSADQAMKVLSPPVFFKYQGAFRTQLQRWRFASLQKVLEKLMGLEADCKKTGAPVETLCAQTILGLSKMRG